MISGCWNARKSESNEIMARIDRRWRWAKACGWTVVPTSLLLLWYAAAMRIGQPWLLPSPALVGEQLLHPFRDHFGLGSLMRNTLVSLCRVGIGFFAAVVVAIPLGLLLGSIRALRTLFDPVVEILRPLCPIAWFPFAIAVFKLKTFPQLFGLSYTHTILDQVQLGMVFILFWGAFFPIFTNTLDGVSGVRRHYINLAQMLGAGRIQSYLHVRLPAAMPSITTGLRQGIGTCWFVIIAAEMLPGSDSGIGYLLIYAADLSAMDVVIAIMVIIGVTGALLNFTMTFTMRTFLRWHGRE